MSNNTSPTSLPKGAGPLPYTSTTTKPQKQKSQLVHKVYLQSSGPSSAMKAPVSKDTPFSEVTMSPYGWNPNEDREMPLTQQSEQFQAMKVLSTHVAQASEHLPRGLPYASVLRR
jgi:hypothetical protein